MTAQIIQKLPIITALILFLWSAPAQSEAASGKIHPPSEIIKIMESSTLVYEIGELAAPVQKERAKGLLSNMLYIEKKDGKDVLKQYSLSEEAKKVLDSAEKAFQAKKFAEALKLYKEVLLLQPGFSYGYTLMGDVYYSTGDYKEAKAVFERAIKNNYIDYHAHWFLADTLWALGEKDKAVTEITIAHLLNVNHAEMLKVLKSYRKEVKKSWQEWEFNPQYSINKTGDKVSLKVKEEWLGYGLVKALWKYEPGYAEKTFGPDYKDQVVCFLEEKEALASLLAGKGDFKNIEKIVKDGFVNEMLLYELAAPKALQILPLLPRDSFLRVVEYVGKYH